MKTITLTPRWIAKRDGDYTFKYLRIGKVIMAVVWLNPPGTDDPKLNYQLKYCFGAEDMKSMMCISALPSRRQEFFETEAEAMKAAEACYDILAEYLTNDTPDLENQQI